VNVALVFILWLTAHSWIVRTTQGTYEDAIHAQNLSGPVAPSLMTRRGLTNWSVWAQFQIGPEPWRMREVNLILSGIVGVLVGLLAMQLGGSGLMASGVMLLHPLTVEPIAMISGRAELFAAIGVVGACLALLRLPRAIGLLTALGCLAFGIQGKESAALAIVLAPLCLLAFPRAVWPIRWVRFAVALGVCVAAVMAWRIRGELDQPEMLITAGSWALHQVTATFRLITLAAIPLGQTIDYDYDHASRLMQIASVGGVVSLAVLVPLLWQRWRLEALGIAWVLIVCAPRWIVRSPRNYLNEHGFYLALVGVALTIAAVAQRQLAHDVS